MTDTFRAMCAELLAAIQLYTKLNPAASDMSPFELTEKLMDAMAATDAALAQPMAVGLTDEELQQMLFDNHRGAIEFLCDAEEEAHLMIRNHVKFARAAIAADRARRSNSQGILDSSPQPVPVSERLPGPEDCDTEDSCWWFDPHADGAWYVDTFQSCYTHWLPSNALPTPEVTND